MFGPILLVIVVFYFFNSKSEESRCMNHQYHTHTAQDILDERFALGEIDREDYLERKQGLSEQKQRIYIKKG